VDRQRIYRLIFTLAGLYNILLGLWAALFPRAFFSLLDLGDPSHPGIWACLGMVVGLYGLVYLQVALTHPAHRISAVTIGGTSIAYDFTRVLIAIGLAGKILGPIGFVLAVRSGEFPMRLLSLLAFDDLIWWAPFAMYLIDGEPAGVWLRRHAPQICAVMHVAAAAATFFWIRGGSEAVSDDIARAHFIRSHVITWRAAWIIWMMAAASLIGFFCWWAAWAVRPRLTATALMIAFAAIAADYFADASFIAWMPDRYADVARGTRFISEVVANGLYSMAGAMMMLATPRLPPRIGLWGWSVWLSGFALAVCGAARWDAGVVASSGVLLVLFTPWVWIAGRALDHA
jgi:hypothetical protein